MPALEDSPEFCKTTLSSMVLNYPPPTIINMRQTFQSGLDRELARMQAILNYLKNDLLIKDEDLLLIVDGTDTWFQLPSDVIIRQYQNVLADANKRLMNQYGRDGEGAQRFNQTIIFGAEKICEGEDLACSYAPESILPSNIYGPQTGRETALTRAKYLDSAMMMGPAKDLRALFEAALVKFKAENSQAGTAQSVFATMFGEQELARAAKSKPGESKAKISKWVDWFGGFAAEPKTEETKTEDEIPSVALEEGQHYEFSIGLDYTHTLFQPLVYAATDELVALPHDNSTDLSTYHHEGTPTPPLHVPTALQQSKPPFWRPDFSKQPSPPDMKLSYIDRLEITDSLDALKPRDTPWSSLALIQNTFTGAIPAVLHLNTPPKTALKIATPPTANLTWDSLWYAGFERALLRTHLRSPQSPIGYHDAAIGGDRYWDSRGGRGGVWTEKEGMWLPWGEVDGVCGTLKQLKEVLPDGKGVWLHEREQNGEQERLKAEEDYNKDRQKEKEEDEKREKEREERERKEKEEREKQQQEKKEKEKEKQQKEVEAKLKEKEKQENAAKGKEGTSPAPKRRGRRWAA